MRPNYDQYMLRLPDGMRSTIKNMASENGRTMNAEIILHLRKAIEVAARAEIGVNTPAAGKVHIKANQPEASSHAAE